MTRPLVVFLKYFWNELNLEQNKELRSDFEAILWPYNMHTAVQVATKWFWKMLFLLKPAIFACACVFLLGQWPAITHQDLSTLHICGFPQIGLPANHPFIIIYRWIFPYKPSSYWGTPFMETSILWLQRPWPWHVRPPAPCPSTGGWGTGAATWPWMWELGCIVFTRLY